MDPKIAAKIHQEFTKYPLRKYPKGQILLFAGDEPKYLFYVVEGKVRKYDISARGDEFAVNVAKPPTVFPMTPLFTQTPSRYFHKAEQNVSAYLVPSKDALAFFKSDICILYGLLERSYRSIDGLQGRIIQLMLRNAKNRVVYELINECKNFSEILPDGSCLLSVNETDLAARSGLSRETVSREINKLKKVGLVVMKGRDIFIPDQTKLNNLL